MSRKNPWTRLKRRIVYENPWIRVFEDDVITPGGTPSIYGLLSARHTAIGVLPIEEDGTIWLVGQWRYALDRFSWECPEGGGRLDADPLDEARRELLEETGLEAENWDEMIRFHLSNSTSDELSICYIATGLKRVAEPDPEDAEADMEIDRVPFMEALNRVLSGEITDSLTVAMLLRAHHMAVTGEIGAPLARAMLGEQGTKP